MEEISREYGSVNILYFQCSWCCGSVVSQSEFDYLHKGTKHSSDIPPLIVMNSTYFAFLPDLLLAEMLMFCVFPILFLLLHGVSFTAAICPNGQVQSAQGGGCVEVHCEGQK